MLSPREAFTLIELLVVMGIILILASLAVAFIPNVAEAERTARGADRLQGWLLVARQWAKRDGVPTGVRLSPGNLYPYAGAPIAPNYVSDLQYIQQPADFSQPATISWTAGSYVVNAAGIDFTGGYSSSYLYPVQPGDYLELLGGGLSGLLHQIDPSSSGSVSYNSGTSTLTLVNDGNPLTGTGPPTSYRIIRGPRILPGEDSLQLPQNVAIDLIQSLAPPASGSGTRDILFGPSGSVIGTSSSRIVLWVRDVTLDAANPGEQTLVTVYCRTGFIAAHPVDTSVNTTLMAPVTGMPGPPPPAQPVQVQNNLGITVGMSLVLDPWLSNSETCQVTAVSGTTGVTLSQVINNHASGAQVISYPYSFALDGRSSGM
jgi:prepilin-type N-terminal cleavage/methylation domain-containing protein